MKFTISKTKMTEALQRTIKIPPKKLSLPILEYARIELGNNQLIIQTTDLEMWGILTIDTGISETGVGLLPIKSVYDLIKDLPESDLVFEWLSQDSLLKIISPVTNFKIRVQSIDDFPMIPKIKAKKFIVIDSKIFNSAITKTIWAVSSEDLRPALCGTYLQIKDSLAEMICTDGRKLSSISFETVGGNIKGVVIPPKILNLVKSFLPKNKKVDKESDDIKLVVEDSRIVIDLPGGTRLISKLIETEYPDCRGLTPDNYDKRAAILQKDLLTTVSRVSMFTDSGTHLLTLNFSQNNVLVLKAVNCGCDTEMTEQVSCDYRGVNFTIGVNANYLISVLHNFKDQRIVMEMASTCCAIKIYSETIPEHTYFTLLMPVRTV